jgi:predicted TIM-barrel fold metal-dependent hydrolase
MLTCVQIYNDWQTEWASADSRRLLPITSIPFWDVAAAAKEVRRCAAAGHRGILFTGEPQSFGQPLLGDAHWNPLWEVAVELDLPISFHIGSGAMPGSTVINRIAAYGRAATYTMGGINLVLQNACQVCDLIMSGVLARYPTIKFVSVESGIGWIPFVLEAMDYQFHGNNVREERPELDLLPSQYFARNVYACCSFEQTALRRLIDEIGRRQCVVRDRLSASNVFIRRRGARPNQGRSFRLRGSNMAQNPLAECTEALQGHRTLKPHASSEYGLKAELILGAIWKMHERIEPRNCSRRYHRYPAFNLTFELAILRISSGQHSNRSKAQRNA